MNLATAQSLRILLRGGGESQNFNAPKSTLYTIKTRYKIFGIQVFFKTTTQIHKTQSLFIWANPYIGKYISTSPNIEQETLALISGLSKENQAFALRQMGRCAQSYRDNNHSFTALSQSEIDEWRRIESEFLPNIFQLGENLYCYKHYLLPIDRFEISVFWHKHSLNILEPSTLAKMRDKDFIDVGGYVGDSALIFEQEFCDKNIYTFEPTRDNYERILQTIKLNNLKRTIPINKGLGAENAKAEIGISGTYGLGSSITFSEHFENTESVQITTLDDFVRENKIEVGFIKVDIEGFEMEFLKGAKETICAQKPAMLLSIYHQPSDYFGIKPLIESWDLGYKFKIHQGIDYSLTVETALFCEVVDKP